MNKRMMILLLVIFLSTLSVLSSESSGVIIELNILDDSCVSDETVDIYVEFGTCICGNHVIAPRFILPNSYGDKCGIFDIVKTRVKKEDDEDDDNQIIQKKLKVTYFEEEKCISPYKTILYEFEKCTTDLFLHETSFTLHESKNYCGLDGYENEMVNQTGLYFPFNINNEDNETRFDSAFFNSDDCQGTVLFFSSIPMRFLDKKKPIFQFLRNVSQFAFEKQKFGLPKNEDKLIRVCNKTYNVDHFGRSEDGPVSFLVKHISYDKIHIPIEEQISDFISETINSIKRRIKEFVYNFFVSPIYSSVDFSFEILDTYVFEILDTKILIFSSYILELYFFVRYFGEVRRAFRDLMYLCCCCCCCYGCFYRLFFQLHFYLFGRSIDEIRSNYEFVDLFSNNNNNNEQQTEEQEQEEEEEEVEGEGESEEKESKKKKKKKEEIGFFSIENYVEPIKECSEPEEEEENGRSLFSKIDHLHIDQRDLTTLLRSEEDEMQRQRINQVQQRHHHHHHHRRKIISLDFSSHSRSEDFFITSCQRKPTSQNIRRILNDGNNNNNNNNNNRRFTINLRSTINHRIHLFRYNNKNNNLTNTNNLNVNKFLVFGEKPEERRMKGPPQLYRLLLEHRGTSNDGPSLKFYTCSLLDRSRRIYILLFNYYVFQIVQIEDDPTTGEVLKNYKCIHQARLKLGLNDYYNFLDRDDRVYHKARNPHPTPKIIIIEPRRKFLICFFKEGKIFMISTTKSTWKELKISLIYDIVTPTTGTYKLRRIEKSKKHHQKYIYILISNKSRRNPPSSLLLRISVKKTNSKLICLYDSTLSSEIISTFCTFMSSTTSSKEEEEEEMISLFFRSSGKIIILNTSKGQIIRKYFFNPQLPKNSIHLSQNNNNNNVNNFVASRIRVRRTRPNYKEVQEYKKYEIVQGYHFGRFREYNFGARKFVESDYFIVVLVCKREVEERKREYFDLKYYYKFCMVQVFLHDDHDDFEMKNQRKVLLEVSTRRKMQFFVGVKKRLRYSSLGRPGGRDRRRNYIGRLIFSNAETLNICSFRNKDGEIIRTGVSGGHENLLPKEELEIEEYDEVERTRFLMEEVVDFGFSIQFVFAGVGSSGGGFFGIQKIINGWKKKIEEEDEGEEEEEEERNDNVVTRSLAVPKSFLNI